MAQKEGATKSSKKDGLTAKQQQIMDLLAKGMAPKDIAAKLGIKQNGVYGHMRRLRANGALNGGTPRKRGSRRGRPRNASRPDSLGAAVRVLREEEARLKTLIQDGRSELKRIERARKRVEAI